MGYTLVGVVGDHGQLIGEQAIAPPDNEVTHVGRDVEDQVSLNAITKDDRRAIDS
jgi:hypothetical protein